MTNPVAAPARSVKPLYLAAVSSGLLLYASFFPLNLGFLAWVALVPLLFLVRAHARPRHIYSAAFLGGLCFYVPAIQWVRVAHPMMYGTWFALSLYSSLYFPFAVWLIRKLDRARLPLALAVPVVWVGLEYMRAHFPTGFPWLEPFGLMLRIGFGWYFLGYSQHEVLPLIQLADLGGVYGVSLLIVLVNTVVFLWISRCLDRSGIDAAWPWRSTAVAGVLLASSIMYGFARLDHPSFAIGPRVALLQSNLPQSVKMERDGEKTVEEHMDRLLKQSAEVAASEYPDLIVWPETTFSEDWIEVASGIDPKTAPLGFQERMAQQAYACAPVEALQNAPPAWRTFVLSHQLAKIMSSQRSNYLLGLNGREWGGDGKIWKYNSAKFIGKDGRPGPRYDKMHLVPFGEYVPLQSTFPWMKNFTPYDHEYSCKPGEHWTRFPLQAGGKTYQFGCLICYEDSDPGMARSYARTSPEGPAVDFLVNISNDGWFDGTEEHEQHLAICRFRAIECRRSVVRAVNMGISAIIDADGRVVQVPGSTWANSKKIAAVVTGPVPIDDRTSLYSLWGDGLPLLCWAIVLGGLVLLLIRRHEVRA